MTMAIEKGPFLYYLISLFLMYVLIMDYGRFKIKKIINLGSMQEFFNSNSYKPKNLYAASKKAYEQFLEFYKVKHKEVQFYNIKLYETLKTARSNNNVFVTF